MAIILRHLMLTTCHTHTADIVFVVKDKPHPLFKREGNDLIYEPDIPLVTVSPELGVVPDGKWICIYYVV